MNVTILVVPLLLLSAASAQRSRPTSKAPADPRAWVEYTFPEDGFAITSPDVPTVHPEPGTGNRGRIYSAHLGPETILSVHVISAQTAGDCAEKLSKLQSSLQAASSSEPIVPGSVREISLQNYRGVEYLEKTWPDGGKYTLWRHYCYANRFFALGLTWVSNDPQKTNADRLLASFRFTPPGERK